MSKATLKHLLRPLGTIRHGVPTRSNRYAEERDLVSWACLQPGLARNSARSCARRVHLSTRESDTCLSVPLHEPQPRTRLDPSTDGKVAGGPPVLPPRPPSRSNLPYLPCRWAAKQIDLLYP